jgi:predicted porin
LTIELQNDNSNGASGANTGLDSDEAYLFLSSPTLGTIRLGDEDSAASLMQVRVPTITGMGPDGNWDELLTNRNATVNRNGNSYMLAGINDGSDATKIIYLSPQFFGFDLGVSYAPNGGEGERVEQGTTTLSQRNRTTISNELSGAVRYRGSFGNFGVAAGFGAMRADAPLVAAGGTSLQEVTAYTVGANVTAFGVTAGGEYTWGNYAGTGPGRAALPSGRDGSSHWVLGATYTIGAFSVGGYYGEGEQDTNPAGVGKRDQSVWGLGVSYNLAPGMDLIGSYNNFSEKRSPDAATVGGDRDVDVIFAGVRLAF